MTGLSGLEKTIGLVLGSVHLSHPEYERGIGKKSRFLPLFLPSLDLGNIRG